MARPSHEGTRHPLQAMCECIPFTGDANLPDNRISNPDKLFLGVSAALDNLLEAVGLEAA